MICNIKYLLNMNDITYIHVMLIYANVMLICIVWAFKSSSDPSCCADELSIYIYIIYMYIYIYTDTYML